MKRRKPKASPRKSGDVRRTYRIEVHLTQDEESIADLMWTEFQESIALAADEKGEEPPACGFADFLAILLRRQFDAYRQECSEACEREGLIP